VKNRVHNRSHCLGGECFSAGDHLVNDGAQRKDIRPCVDSAPVELFRRHVLVGATQPGSSRGAWPPPVTRTSTHYLRLKEVEQHLGLMKERHRDVARSLESMVNALGRRLNDVRSHYAHEETSSTQTDTESAREVKEPVHENVERAALSSLDKGWFIAT
jgi:hypothetical protein